MSTKTKYPRSVALAVAKELCDALRGACEKLVVAGSLRRGKTEVGDVEILFVPKLEKDGLFDEDTCNLAELIIKSMLEGKVLRERPNSKGFLTWGEQNKFAVHCESGVPVDLFSVPLENWWNSLVCRTGGKDNNLLITTTAQKKGWTWNAYGSGFTNLTTGETYQTQSEQDIYGFLGLRYIEPRERQ